MKTFKFPKKYKRFRSANVFEMVKITFSETDVERMMAQVSERMFRGGRVSKRLTPLQAATAYDLDLRIESMKSSGHFSNFSGGQGTLVLRGWLESTLINRVKAGRGSGGKEKILFLNPITAAIYRSGLPGERQRHRHADELIYWSVVRELQLRNIPNPEPYLHALSKSSLGRGLELETLDVWRTPKYDGVSKIDINELMAIRFCESFPPAAADELLSHDGIKVLDVIPDATRPLGQDYVTTLQLSVEEEWSTEETFSALISITAIRLIQLPLRMGMSLRQAIEGLLPTDGLVPDGEEKEMFHQFSEEAGPSRCPNPLEQYVDFTRVAGSFSDLLARQCVARDIDALRRFYQDRMAFRARSVAAEGLFSSAEISNIPAEQLIHKMFALDDLPEAQQVARFLLSDIKNALLDDDHGQQLDEVSLETLETISSAGDTPLSQLTELFTLANQSLGTEGLIKWFKAVGGLQRNSGKKHAILSGTDGARQTWRYAPTDALVYDLIDLCFIDDAALSGNQAPRPKKYMSMTELLGRLKSRFGILIDVPPANMDSPTNRAAAKDNFVAFSAMLKELGCYQGLSDDVEAQYVSRPRRRSSESRI